MADFAITEAAVSARVLLAASPLASTEATATGEIVTEWLKITLVPLLVFLIGACLWGCIKKSAACRMLTADKGSARTGGADPARTVDNSNNSTDLEAGPESSHVVVEMVAATSTNVESTAAAPSTHPTPTNETS